MMAARAEIPNAAVNKKAPMNLADFALNRRNESGRFCVRMIFSSRFDLPIRRSVDAHPEDVLPIVEPFFAPTLRDQHNACISRN